jgi:hypothetical protein
MTLIQRWLILKIVDFKDRRSKRLSIKAILGADRGIGQPKRSRVNPRSSVLIRGKVFWFLVLVLVFG